jgi:hypothetical protein
MSAKDVYHDTVRNALEKDGWIITADPLVVTVEETALLIDLGAERVLAAERNDQRIAVEIKSFLRPSQVQDLKEALGQYMLYEEAPKHAPRDSDRTLYLAIRFTVFADVFEEGIGKLFLESHRVRLIVFDPDAEAIVRWID